MDPVENERRTAQELVSHAQLQGIDLVPLCNDSIFDKDNRWIFLWRKLDGLPCTGPANEKDGTLHYNMQGTIAVLPRELKDSASAFQGMWSESGTVENIEEALELLKAWLLNRKEVDDLPCRFVKRHGF